MTALSITAADVRPLDGAVTQGYDLGGAADIGDLVYVATDDDVERADGSAQASARAIGIVVAIQGGASSGTEGDAATICTFGPVAGFAGLTGGALGYVSDTAGEIHTNAAAGTYERSVGYARSATVFYVQPEMSNPAS